MKSPQRSTGLVFTIAVLFFASGATSLVYQVVWARMFSRVFGGTALAISIVLASFMGGLALGSFLWGRRADRHRRPLVTYGLLELGIAVTALALPHILRLLHPAFLFLYRAGLSSHWELTLVRGAASFLILLVPTTFMGGTLPVLSRALVDRLDGLGTRLGMLYGINTFGAMAGAFGGGFFLIGALGLGGTVVAAAAANGLIGVVAVILGRRRILSLREAGSGLSDREGTERIGMPAGEPRPSAAIAKPPPSRATFALRAVILAYAVSGAAALALEVVWTRYLSMVVGTTVYAFSGMLTVFLFGLAAGSFLMGRVVDRTRRLTRLFAGVEIALGIAILGSLFLLGRYPELFVSLYHRWGSSWWGVAGLQFFLFAIVLILPALLFGSVFPIVTKFYARELSRVGERVGTAYAANTLGAIIGSLAGGFILLPHLGIQGSTILCATACMVVGIALLALLEERFTPTRRFLTAAPAAAVLVILVVALPPWDARLVSRGTYIYADEYPEASALRRAAREMDLLFYEEGPEGTISVEYAGGVTSLRVNGKVDAGNGRDMVTEALLGHLPLVLHPRPERALVIGLGSGITLGAVEAHPVREITCAEISPAVIRAAELFRDDHRDALGDPRLTMVRADARNYLSLEPTKYDCITTEPSNPWISGMNDLFTREFFELMRARLTPGGLVCQWVQIYGLSSDDVRTILRTFQSVFPHAMLWMGTWGDLLVVGSPQEIRVDAGVLRDRLEGEEVRQTLTDAGFESSEGVWSLFLMDSRGIRSLVGEGPIVTDDNLLLEFTGARHIRRDPLKELLGPFISSIQCLTEVVDAQTGLSPELRAALEDACGAHRLLLRSALAGRAGRFEEALSLVGQAHELAPDDANVRDEYASACLYSGASLLRQSGPTPEVMSLLTTAAEIGGTLVSLRARKDLGLAYFQTGRLDSALIVWRRAAETDPHDASLFYSLGMVTQAQGRPGEAVPLYERALAIRPDHPNALTELANLYAEGGGDLRKALESALRAVELNPGGASTLVLGKVRFRRGEYEKAVDVLRPVAVAPGWEAEASLYLAESLMALGRPGEARVAYERVIATDKSGALAQHARQALVDLEGR